MFKKPNVSSKISRNFIKTETCESHEIEKSAHDNPQKNWENFMKVKTIRAIVKRKHFVSFYL